MWSVLRSKVLFSNCKKQLSKFTYCSFNAIPDPKDMKLIRSIDEKLDTSSDLSVETPIHVKIEPVNNEDITKHDHITMQIYSKNGNSSNFKVKQSSKRLELVSTGSDNTDICIMKVPHNIKINIVALKNACVSIEKILMEDVKVKSECGNIFIDNIQAGNISVESDEGAVKTNGIIRGSNVEIKTGSNSGIFCNNIASNSLKLNTHEGSINIKSCYSENSHFITALGDIKIDHLHRTSIVDIIHQGNLHINSLDGSLQASLKSGNVFLHISKLIGKSSIFIHEKGKVDLKLSEASISKDILLNLYAEKINIDEAILSMGRLMDDTHPHRFRYPLDVDIAVNELLVECRNGSVELQRASTPFFLNSLNKNINN